MPVIVMNSDVYEINPLFIFGLINLFCIIVQLLNRDVFDYKNKDPD